MNYFEQRQYDTTAQTIRLKTLRLVLVNEFKLTVRLSFSHLVEFELKTEDVAEGEWLAHVRLDEREKELVLVRSTLIHLQDDVQNPVWIQVETSCASTRSRKSEQLGNTRKNVNESGNGSHWTKIHLIFE